ncbi:hypothetical protein A4G20_03600 [Pasteurellaceae bacterium RH1A]|nr:hypothetical protein A4G20_03600 [Pasteurellaceae bacterium RH1A]
MFSALTHQNWPGYLKFLLLTLGAGLFSSGIITWLAANWDYFSDAEKIYGMQALLLALALLSACFYARGQKAYAKGASFVLSVAIGGLLALVGQTYQTGANAWQLFALWSVCQIPLLILLPNLPAFLLFIATSHASIDLFYPALGQTAFFYAALWSFTFLALSEYSRAALRDERHHILPKVLLALGLGHLLLALVALPFNSSLDGLGYLGSWAWVGCLIFYYKNKRFDFINLSLCLVYMVLSSNFFLLDLTFNKNGTEMGLVFSFFFPALMALGSFFLLAHWFKQKHQVESKLMSWGLTLILFWALLMGLGTLLALLFLGLEEEGILASSLLCFILSLVLYRKERGGQLSPITQHILGFFLLLSYSFYFIYFFFENGQINLLALLLGSLVMAYFYVKRPSPWFRVASAFSLLAVWYIYIDTEIFTNVYALYGYYTLPLLSLALFALGAKRQPALSFPLAWACWIFVVLMNWNETLLQSSSQLALGREIYSLQDMFYILIGRNLEGFTPSLPWLGYLALCLAPLLIFWLNSHKQSLGILAYIALSLLWLLTALGFIASGQILFYVALLLLAYRLNQRLVLILALACLVLELGLYYYSLAIPLLYKGISLILYGLLFLISSLFLPAQKAASNPVPAPKAGWQVPSAILALGLAVLGLVNYKVHQFEDILSSGQPVILKIAPVDPRSLMQGDYMILNYQILNEIQDEMYQQNLTGSLYALVQTDQAGLASFCRLSAEEPSNFTGCQPGVYLPINTFHHNQPRLPSQDYFFAEGLGEYYAQAEYAEYRFKEGKLLLKGLLDKNLKPL